ncbi:MAG: hypothetical protein GX895_11030 [Clostridiales bacterium]|uniref:hypothetical protein n=1 Tax=Clostridium sp. N3C TaxID=1776758 RepID=UPI00092E172E|nr:hypothetical protein [Clostridium sp. N3C]NLZ49288.1 hypothetical protein [Clostridiales bacterium]SCN25153.1 hypothetical protein N3C_2188 [Clostridium sp. N3C]
MEFRDSQKSTIDKAMCPVKQKGQCPMDKIYSNPMMANYNIPAYQMANMPLTVQNERQIEMLYPRSYYIIYPHVRYQCDMLERKYGKNYCPTKEEMEDILEDIYIKVEKELDKDDDDKKDKDHCRGEDRKRRRPYDRRRLLNDLIGIILIGELLDRRRTYYGPGFWY